MNDDNSQSDEQLISEIAEEQQQNQVSLGQKIAQNNPFVKFGTTSIQNVQTQSLVKSSREEAGEQLAAIDAANAEALRRQQMQQNVQKAEKTGVYVLVAIIIAAIVIAAGWLIISAVIAGRHGVAPAKEDAQEDVVTYSEIDGYKCTSKRCEKVTNVSSTSFIVHDGEQFNIYDTETGKKTNTSIPEREYHSISPFKWGEKTYAILDPESGKSALYSISTNLLLTDFSYDEFITDIKNAAYNEMQSIAGKYIIAKAGSNFRLIDALNGKEVAHGAKRVYTRGIYFFGYETDGTTFVYAADGSTVVVVKKGDPIFLRDDTVIVVHTEDDSFDSYRGSADADNEGPVYQEIYEKIDDHYYNALKKDKRYYQIPANN
ncbi:hypothetical protein IK110_03495 [Candidatus Saccharibacteria bacterium]|nr:hypothetical protein [Candidatus Saccharibacteria bacterium]